MSRAFSFGALSLQSPPFSVLDTDFFDAPERDIIFEELARSDNAVAVYRKYKSRTVNMGGMITDSSSDLLDADIDTLKLALLGAGQNALAAAYAGGQRILQAEAKNVMIPRASSDISRSAWSAQFFCEKGHFTDGTTQTFLSLTENLRSDLIGVNVKGTYLGLPYITLTITSISPNDNTVNIVVGNPASSEYLTIAGPFANGDVVTIDCLKEEVYKNSLLIAPSGNFPGWAPGAGLVDYSDTAVSGSIVMAGTYQPRYL